MTISKDLCFSHHIKTTCSKLNQRLYFLRKLRSFNVDKTLLKLFYTSILQSVFTFCIVAFGGNITDKDKTKIQRVIKRASKISSFNFDSFDFIYKSFCLKKINSILRDTSHPLFNQISISERSGRFISLNCKTERYLHSFLPSAVRFKQELFIR